MCPWLLFVLAAFLVHTSNGSRRNIYWSYGLSTMLNNEQSTVNMLKPFETHILRICIFVGSDNLCFCLHVNANVPISTWYAPLPIMDSRASFSKRGSVLAWILGKNRSWVEIFGPGLESVRELGSAALKVSQTPRFVPTWWQIETVTFAMVSRSQEGFGRLQGQSDLLCLCLLPLLLADLFQFRRLFLAAETIWRVCRSWWPIAKWTRTRSRSMAPESRRGEGVKSAGDWWQVGLSCEHGTNFRKIQHCNIVSWRSFDLGHSSLSSSFIIYHSSFIINHQSFIVVIMVIMVSHNTSSHTHTRL